MAKRLELPKFQAFADTTPFLSGGKVWTYKVGTSTPKASYTTPDGDVENANPVILDSRGAADIYLKGKYKINILDEDDVQVSGWPVDDVEGSSSGENFYYPDATATNQGVTGDSDTIKYAVDTIGSDKGTIYLSHNSGDATTTYTLTTSEVLPAGIKIALENGAIIDGAGTLTINGSIDAGPYQIFGSSITIEGDPIVDATVPEWWGAAGDGSIEDYAAVNAALTHWYQRTLPGKFKFLSGKNYLISTAISLTLSTDVIGSWTIEGYGSKITSGVASGTFLTLTTPSLVARHLVIAGLTIWGSGTADNLITLNGGDDPAKYFYGVVVRDCYLENFVGNGLTMLGSFFESAVENVHARAKSNNTTGYGIYAYNGAAATAVVSSLLISKCSTDYGYYGIYVKTPTGDVKVQNCTSIRAQYEGIFLESNFGSHALNNHVEVNYQSAGSVAVGQAGLKVIGNGTVSGTMGVGANQAHAVRVFAAAGDHMTVMEGQSFSPVTHHAYLEGGIGSHISYFGTGNYYTPNDTPNETVGRIGNAHKSLEPTTTIGTGEDIIGTYTLLDSNLGKYEGLKITASGIKTGANGNKTLKFYFGATTCTFHAAANNTNDWRFQAEVMNYRDDTNQFISWVGYDGATILQGTEAAAEDTTGGDIIVKITGECAHADDAIQIYSWIIERI